jgi:uncharacterized protein with gpF-like domain
MKLVSPTESDVVCDAVYPNVGVESWYYNTLLIQIGAMADEMQRALASAPWDENLLARDAKANDDLSHAIRRALDAWASKWTDKWAKMSERIAYEFATKSQQTTDYAVQQSFKRAGFVLKFKPTKPMLLAFNSRVQANVDLIRSIPQEYLKDVSQKVWQHVSAGGDMAALSADIQRVYQVTQHRAALIARDQNNKGKAVFEDVRRMELGIEEAAWQHSAAGKEPRPTHVEAGQKRERYNIKQGWLDPADGKYKRPGEDINCRCTSRAVIPGLRRRT